MDLRLKKENKKYMLPYMNMNILDGLLVIYQSFAKYYKDFDSVNVVFYSTTDLKPYN